MSFDSCRTGAAAGSGAIFTGSGRGLPHVSLLAAALDDASAPEPVNEGAATIAAPTTPPAAQGLSINDGAAPAATGAGGAIGGGATAGGGATGGGGTCGGGATAYTAESGSLARDEGFDAAQGVVAGLGDEAGAALPCDATNGSALSRPGSVPREGCAYCIVDSVGDSTFEKGSGAAGGRTGSTADVRSLGGGGGMRGAGGGAFAAGGAGGGSGAGGAFGGGGAGGAFGGGGATVG